MNIEDRNYEAYRMRWQADQKRQYAAVTGRDDLSREADRLELSAQALHHQKSSDYTFYKK